MSDHGMLLPQATFILNMKLICPQIPNLLIQGSAKTAEFISQGKIFLAK